MYNCFSKDGLYDFDNWVKVTHTQYHHSRGWQEDRKCLLEYVLDIWKFSTISHPPLAKLHKTQKKTASCFTNFHSHFYLESWRFTCWSYALFEVATYGVMKSNLKDIPQNTTMLSCFANTIQKVSNNVTNVIYYHFVLNCFICFCRFFILWE